MGPLFYQIQASAYFILTDFHNDEEMTDLRSSKWFFLTLFQQGKENIKMVCIAAEEI